MLTGAQHLKSDGFNDCIGKGTFDTLLDGDEDEEEDVDVEVGSWCVIIVALEPQCVYTYLWSV